MTKAVQLSEGEEIIALFRRHWFHLAVEGLVALLIFVLVFVVKSVAVTFMTQSGVVTNQGGFALILYALSFTGLVLWMYFFASWSDHWLDAWIVTNKRVIDIEQHGFFRRQVSSFPIDRIQDVTFKINGPIAMWLHFGDVRIQTASISDDLIMKQIPFPEDVKETIVQVIEAERKTRRP